ncbi:HAD-IIB family hydrolase [Mediterraneibacter glycyrrhizinilyticus]|nr:HAD-IIB family hydrolase [Mediterraneibacter glycyrrhizinilyticus]MBM6855544.1 HAD-IIB family hydrolase [Mediterraneibacter glycyrrhizinilyticus]
MRIRCIALDLDRTTLNSEGHLSGDNRKAIEQAISSGIQIAVASGRSLDSLPGEVMEIPGIRYAITSNGAAVYDLKEGVCLRQYKLKAEAVQDILRWTQGEDVTFEAFIDGKPYAEKAYVEDPVRFGAMPRSIPYIQGTRKPTEDMRSFIREHEGELDCIDVVVKSEEYKRRLWKTLEKQVRDVYITSSVKQLLEISDVNAGKNTAAEFLIGYLGLTREELAGFGDGHNDSGLLRYAGIGFAVANASEECREAADRMVASNDEDGVAEGIDYILKVNGADRES